MSIDNIIFQIANEIYSILSNALNRFSDAFLTNRIIILPKWLPQIFRPNDVIIIGQETYSYITASALLQTIITITVWYLCITITYKFLKKLFKLGFGVFGL